MISFGIGRRNIHELEGKFESRLHCPGCWRRATQAYVTWHCAISSVYLKMIPNWALPVRQPINTAQLQPFWQKCTRMDIGLNRDPVTIPNTARLSGRSSCWPVLARVLMKINAYKKPSNIIWNRPWHPADRSPLPPLRVARRLPAGQPVLGINRAWIDGCPPG